MRRSRKALAVLPAAAVAVAGFAGAGGPAASARTSASARASGISPIARTRAETAISVRITALDAANTLVQQTGWFAGSDQAALENIITGDLNGNGQAPGLNSLAVTIRNETDPTKFRAEAASIFADYRVFALALPQVKLVRASDRMTTDTVPTLKQLDTDLEQAIAQEAAEGKNVQAAQAAVHDLEAQIASIGQKTSGVSAALLALTPAQWNANHGVVSPYRNDVHAAVAAARHAQTDVRTALKDLQ
ncbi:MAG TPA: hypothetical protein VGL49_06370 [Acidimicrobiales bacterium]